MPDEFDQEWLNDARRAVDAITLSRSTRMPDQPFDLPFAREKFASVTVELIADPTSRCPAIAQAPEINGRGFRRTLTFEKVHCGRRSGHGGNHLVAVRPSRIRRSCTLTLVWE